MAELLGVRVRVPDCVDVRDAVCVRDLVELDVPVAVAVALKDGLDVAELVDEDVAVLVMVDDAVLVRELVRDRLAVRVAVAEDVRVAVDD